MAVKQKTIKSHTKIKPQQDKAIFQAALILFWALAGLLIPRCGIYGGMSPFGVGLAAAMSGPGAALVYVATAAGYMFSGGIFPLRYVAAVAIAAGIRWMFNGIKPLAGSKLMPPIAAFLGTGAAGFAIGLWGSPDTYTGLLLCESIIAGGFAFFVHAAAGALEHYDGQPLSVQQQAAVGMTGALILISLAGVEFSGISPGRILAVAAILLMARAGREQSGAIAGVTFGVALTLTSPDHMILGVSYAFGGLMAGMFSRFGKFAAAAAFLVGSVVLMMSAGTGDTVVAGVYEAAAAAVIFVVLPPAVSRALHRLFARGHELPAVEGLRRSVVMKLDFSADALEEVAGAVDVVSKKLARLAAPDLGTVYRNVSDEVCRDCGKRYFCWEQHYNGIMDSFNGLSLPLREQGSVTGRQAEGHLSKYCVRLDEVMEKVNIGYNEYLVREGAFRRLGDIRNMASDQFSNTAELLREMAADFGEAERVDEEAAARVKTACAAAGIKAREAVCILEKSNRMTVEILAEDNAGEKCEDNRDWLSEMEVACSRYFDRPAVVRLPGVSKIILRELPQYHVSTAVAQLNCKGERLCGDAAEIVTDAAGRLTVVLSDGMGSGGRAAVDGAMTAIMAGKLLQAGFSPDSVLRMVNAALMVKSGDESLATLDILSVDLFSGQMESMKAGAAASLLLSRGRVSRIERSSLPVGILRDIVFEKYTDTLTEGDIILLMSDGVLTAGIAWVEETLAAYDPKRGSLSGLADNIAAAARQRQPPRQDDISVVALRVSKRK